MYHRSKMSILSNTKHAAPMVVECSPNVEGSIFKLDGGKCF